MGSCNSAAWRLAMLAFTFWLPGCAYHGNSEASIENPVVQKASWFSFLDGNDIRETCAAPGAKGGAQAPDRYRLVYNGQYGEQLRVYEIAGLPSGGATLSVRVKGRSNLANWVIKSPADLFQPWRWQEATDSLGPAEFDQFRASLARAGYGSGAPQGLRLPSQDFYWVAAGCSQGRFHFYAWLEQGGSFPNAPFQDFLLRHDGTGVPFHQPHVLDVRDRQDVGSRRNRNGGGAFTLEVRGEGFGGLVNAF